MAVVAVACRLVANGQLHVQREADLKRVVEIGGLGFSGL